MSSRQASVFVDTSAWYAAVDADDASHRRATARLSEYSGSLVTSDHVLAETWYLTASRINRDVAERAINGIRAGVARIESAQTADLEAASAIYQEFPNQEFSIVDRTSWSVMRRLGLTEAIAFDVDYSIYRFGRGRRQAFTVYS